MSTLTLSLLAAFAGAAEPVAPAAPVSGIDVQYIDAGVRPQDDFYSYLNGKWLKTIDIPADKSSWGAFAKLRDDTLPQLRDIIEAAQKDGARKPGSDAQKIADLYGSYMDQAHLDALGLKPGRRTEPHPVDQEQESLAGADLALERTRRDDSLHRLRRPGRARLEQVRGRDCAE